MVKKSVAFAALVVVLSAGSLFASEDVSQREARIRDREERSGIVRVVINKLKGAVRGFSDLLGGPRP